MSDQSSGPGWWQASDGKWYPPATDSGATQPVSDDSPGAPPSWWKRSVPLWALILAAVLGLGIGGAASSSDDNGDDVAAKDTTTTDRKTTTTEERTTTTERATTTTTRPPTTTTTPPTPEQLRDLAKAGFQAAFDRTRPTVVDVLQKDSNVETLDQFIYEPGADRVSISVTSAWASPDNQVDGAWEITRGMAVLYERDSGEWWNPSYVPGLHFVNSGTVYDCPGDLMVRLGSLEADRGAWESEC